jgi:hypothetical protein
MISIALENKDRLSLIWPIVKRHLQWLLSEFGKNPSIVERAVIGLLRVANRTLFRVKDDIAEEILHSLSLLLVSAVFISKNSYYLIEFQIYLFVVIPNQDTYFCIEHI